MKRDTRTAVCTCGQETARGDVVAVATDIDGRLETICECGEPLTFDHEEQETVVSGKTCTAVASKTANKQLDLIGGEK